jgi:hypothetical protein
MYGRYMEAIQGRGQFRHVFKEGRSDLPSTNEFKLRSRLIRISGTTEKSALMKWALVI